MEPGPSRSQISCSDWGSSQAANALDRAVNSIPSRMHWRLAHSWPLIQALIGYGKYAQILINAGPKSVSQR